MRCPSARSLATRTFADHLVDRTVYRIVESDPGVGVVVEDLRTAERLTVRERTFSHQARPDAGVRPGGAGFENMGSHVPEGAVGMRPERLRDLLGLDT